MKTIGTLAAALAVGACLASPAAHAQSAQVDRPLPEAEVRALFPAFEEAERTIQQLEARVATLWKSPNEQQFLQALRDNLQFRSIASGETGYYTDAGYRAVKVWKPALVAAWLACTNHLASSGQFEPLFKDVCFGLEVRYNRAEEAVGYVLAKRRAAPDLALIARAVEVPK